MEIPPDKGHLHLMEVSALDPITFFIFIFT